MTVGFAKQNMDLNWTPGTSILVPLESSQILQGGALNLNQR